MSIQEICLIRHGETEWSVSGQHTGVSDIPLTERGREAARRLRRALVTRRFTLVMTSPLQRARMTCELAGLGQQAHVEPDLVEWHYGAYEGLTPRQIRASRPTWLIFRDGCPDGENPAQVGKRVDRIIERVRADGGPAAVFSHGHVLRVFAARWLGMPPLAGSQFLLDTATLSVLSSYRGVPAVKSWNAPLVTAHPEEEDS